MHLDLGGKLTSGKPYWSDFGAKFGHFVGDVEAKSGYGMGHVEAICQILFGHVVGFVPRKVPSPRNTKILSGFWRAMFYPFAGQMQGWK